METHHSGFRVKGMEEKITMILLMGMIWGLLGWSDSYIIKFLTQQESIKDPKI